ncbi:hypothetical protein LINPERPRIM_LOCUS23745, partial [Linum perenne]
MRSTPPMCTNSKSTSMSSSNYKILVWTLAVLMIS